MALFLGFVIVVGLATLALMYLVVNKPRSRWHSDARKVERDLPAVVHVVPAEVFDFAHARRLRERMLAEEAFMDTGWGTNGRIH